MTAPKSQKCYSGVDVAGEDVLFTVGGQEWRSGSRAPVGPVARPLVGSRGTAPGGTMGDSSAIS